MKEWRSVRFRDVRRNKRGRPRSSASIKKTEQAELLKTIRNLIEDFSARCSVNKVDVLSSVVADCHDTWETDGSKFLVSIINLEIPFLSNPSLLDDL